MAYNRRGTPIPVLGNLLLRRIQTLLAEYPGQFWLLFWGNFIVSVGNSMSWPFLTIYIRESFNLPLTFVASILTIRSIAGLLNSFIAGPASDRFGRKWLIVLSLFISGTCFFLMTRVQSIAAWIIVMALYGAFQPVFRVGADAMVADIVPEEKRLNAYSLMRIISNLGISFGPIIGGILASVSYARAFRSASFFLLVMGMFSLFLVKETLSKAAGMENQDRAKHDFGYSFMLKDRKFLSFMFMLTLTVVGGIMMFVLLPVYVKEQYGLSEIYFGWILSTNGLMIALFQYPITLLTKNKPKYLMLTLGAVFYGIGIGSVVLGNTFPDFVISMAVITIGEMIMMPTAMTMAANMAPPDMRGRYMSVFNLTYTFGMGIGSIVGGVLNDLIAPVAMWFGGSMFGFLSAIGFLYLFRKNPSINKYQPAVSEENP